jgi:8-oxo-dGTP diphosphatase
MGAASRMTRPDLTALISDSVIPFCLVYLLNQDEVLLIRKAEGRLHEGQWIGLGGKIEPGEDPVSSAILEFKEESGLVLEDPMLRGTFVWIDEAKYGIIHIVVGTEYTGRLSESEEGELRWHRIEKLLALEGLAKHQRLFLDRLLRDSDYFYSGVAVYQNGEMVGYADSNSFLAKSQSISDSPGGP